ncbi:hypothetical protein AQ619_18245 (plasmid) [Caulobacter henricii]|uniref:Uncharacterized protein n=2 Tax=Caulobacter henricii TaxID=69395 RepID=A0A0P0P529_9CAUL|nr:hypothetical protein AQ619_18245 [Caulobacter henricii]
MALVCPALGLMMMIAQAAGWFAHDGFVYRYQTLIGAVFAILAAVIAVVPVWRQLTSMRIQTGALYRQFLSGQVDAIVARRKRLLGRIDDFTEPAGRRLYEDQEFGDGRVNPHWAFEQEQRADRLADDLRAYLDLRRDPVEVDEHLEAVIAATLAFEARCRAIHFTDSHEQSDDDHDIPDEDWARLIAEGLEAEPELSADLASVTLATLKLRDAFDREIVTMRQTLRTLDRELTRSWS